MSEPIEVKTPVEDMFTIYDRDGECVGRVCMGTGRALIAGEFCQALRGSEWSEEGDKNDGR